VKHSLLICLFIAAPGVLAGYHYTATTKLDDKTNKQKSEMAVEAWIDGDKAKILFTETNNPLTPKGAYIITTDGGKLVYLVNPEKKNYQEWDMNQLLNLAGSITAMVKIQFSDLKLEKQDEHASDKIHGYATRYYKYLTSYDLRIKVIGIKRVQSVITEQETWVSDRLNDISLGLWLRNEPPSTGDPELDKLIKAEMSKVKGFPLRSKTKTVTRQWNKKKTKVKKETVSYADMEVNTFKKMAIEGATFAIPDDYELVQGVTGGLKGIFNQ